ncbi:MAG TPA: hypothetical protein VF646_12765 [Cytophagales bacterium]|jgi:8-amino-7-oxononanoate synthase
MSDFAPVDFSSALYLGRRSFGLPVPGRFTLTAGKPAALHEPALHRAVAREVARRQGLEDGLLGPSTFHLFWDLFGMLPRTATVLVDESTYRVGRWGVARALLGGVPVRFFPAGDTVRLGRLLHGCAQEGRTPWVLTDGWWMAGNCPAPLGAYLRGLAPFPRGVLLVDDTQAFGILGARPDPALPWGYGGGGTLPCLGLRSHKLVAITSLGKGLGVPVAVLAGSAARLRRCRLRSDVRVHTSPASDLHAWAAWQALQGDAAAGDGRRKKLYRNCLLFRKLLPEGAAAGGHVFPVQKLRLPDAGTALGLHARLGREGIEALLLAGERRAGPAGAVPEVAFCLRADHTTEQVRRAAARIRAFFHESSFTLTPAPRATSHDLSQPIPKPAPAAPR